MLAKLKGQIDSIEEDNVILDVSGVGYLVHCSAITIGKLSVGIEASLLIDTIVREDSISLYGFGSKQEQDSFRMLTTVKGVGNKMAINVLSSLTPENIARAIIAGDIYAFQAISGVGKKLAERIILELKDKFKNYDLPKFDSTTASSNIPAGANAILDDAVSALINLGVPKNHAYNVVSKILALEPECSLDKLIRKSLKEMA